MGQSNCHPEPGDLIQIKRPLYQHWALYVGGGYVIHLTGDSNTSLSGNTNKKARVEKQLLKEVAGNNKWRVNNKYDRFCKPLPVYAIIQLAERWIGKEVPYNVLLLNCEHFATLLRYGVGISEQVTNAFHRIATVAGIVFGAVSLVL